MEAYFAGNRAALDDLQTATNGTPFQRKVWAALRTIEAGETVSYGTLAVRIGQPTAARAVGLANGQNPIAIVVPCHRVIGADASLTGYGGGIERKRWLLAHEACAALP
jgi:methylated-DNA-[protein]-cysteine S-methyltransferase